VLLEKDGEDQLDWSFCEKGRSIAKCEGRNILHTKDEGRLTGLVTSWRNNCLIKHVIEGKTERKKRRRRKKH
jgi:hypothetical protein